MADQTVTQADLSSLAKKLDDLGDVLTEKERGVLLAVFNLAASAIQSRIRGNGGDGSDTESAQAGGGHVGTIARSVLPPLSDGFKNAFKPIGNNDFTIRDNGSKVAGGVGIGVIW